MSENGEKKIFFLQATKTGLDKKCQEKTLSQNLVFLKNFYLELESVLIKYESAQSTGSDIDD